MHKELTLFLLNTCMKIEVKNRFSPYIFSFFHTRPTNVGKSTFVFKLLKHADGAFAKPIKAIYYCYSVDQPLFAEMKKAIPNINFYKSLPKASELESWNELEPRDKVLVIDDMMAESAKLVGCFGLNGPLRQYFSLYRAVSKREGERKDK